jgi:hypothetical protein
MSPTAPTSTVSLKGTEIPLTPPSSLTICREVVLCAAQNMHRACFAALGVCWRPLKGKKGNSSISRPQIAYAACDYNPLRFGGEFADALQAQGVPVEELYAAGYQAYLLLTEQLPDEKEEARAAGN